MIGAATSLTVMAVLVRFLTPQVPVEEQIFLRNVITVGLTLPWLMRSGLSTFRTSRFGGHALRNGLLYSGNVAWFYGVTLVPLADLSALQFTMPLFTVVLAAMFLRERVGHHRWIATAIGFAGALIIIQPTGGPIQAGAFVVLAAAFFYSCAFVVTKRLSDTESGTVVVFYMGVTITVYSCIPAMFVWVTPSWSDLPALVGLGIAGYSTHFCVTRSMAAADASFVVPFDFLRLPMSAVLGFVLFTEPLDPWTWGGAAVIFGAAYYNTWKEAREGKKPLR